MSVLRNQQFLSNQNPPALPSMLPNHGQFTFVIDPQQQYARIPPINVNASTVQGRGIPSGIYPTVNIAPSTQQPLNRAYGHVAIQPPHLTNTTVNSMMNPNTSFNSVANVAPPQQQEANTKKRKAPTTPSTPSKKQKIVDLPKKLHSLEKDELIDLITSLPTKFPAKYNDLSNDLLSICPDANVDSAIKDLEALRKSVKKAFPNARFGTNRDDYAFKRVKPVLAQFKKAVLDKTAEVKDGQNWSVMCRYLNGLLEIVEDLPDFDHAAHNKTKDTLVKHCITNYNAMLRARDCNLTQEELDSISQALETCDKLTDEAFKEVVERLDKKKN